ncbi:conserved exported hypothetical protein [Candidatus Sulfotelmatomonas gaucii]|uniref:DUF362 domain-containing protein n=1 Tax=Candidatus Sulfuritelmatomonas gaucii TaxID=2043161 RepID=A0A2N9M3N7_9BACT|nr:conserved exported hypothetical protein [Candidatus Sulfotelmatomonas gaucii]
MKSRREFLKDAATGAIALGSAAATEKLGFAGMLGQQSAEHATTGRSRVVIARDASLEGTGAQPDEQRVLNLLDKAMAAYTGREKPVEAWKNIIPPNILAGGVIGLKVNGLGGRGISTHAALTMAVAERLQQAGVRAGNILVWDRDKWSLGNCGMSVNTDAGRVRCYGNDVGGYEDEQVQCGAVRVRLTKILTRECAMVINLPILKDHEMAGITFSMKNMYGAVDRPYALHGNNCNPGVADVNCMPVVREKVKFTIGDALSSVYDGGPGFRPERLWYPNALVVGEDRVALDTIAWGMIEQKRAEAGLLSLEAAGRRPDYIATAADGAHWLGTNDPRQIHLLNV